MKGFLNDKSPDFGTRAPDARHPSHSATADPGQSPEACRQAERTAEVGFSLLLLGKARRVPGLFSKAGVNGLSQESARFWFHASSRAYCRGGRRVHRSRPNAQSPETGAVLLG